MVSKKSLEQLGLTDDLFDGESRSGLLCPKCEGGRTRERSMSAWRDGHHIYYKCHRASCGAGGRVIAFSSEVGSVASRDDEAPTARGSIPRILEIPDTSYGLLLERYGIPEGLLARAGAGWIDSGKGRLYLPCLGPGGETNGYVARSLAGEEPKALIHRLNTDIGKDLMAFYKGPGRALVIVEDQLSAIRASQYTNSVALVGTHLSDSRMESILSTRPSKMFIALDKDATDKAIKYAFKYGIKIIPLEKDLKDCTEDELLERLEPCLK